MLHRAMDGYWHVVAGVVEEGETFAKAAVRELREETGLDAVVIALGIQQTYQVPDERRSQYLTGVSAVAIENFAVEVRSEWEPVLNEEHDDYRWLTASEAIAIAHWPETRAVIVAVAALTF
jgi:8-oxo-dGTP pyrophosphatase MutT (NUDIX family)